MAKKTGVRIAILVEDEALERFARSVLLKFGFARHELRVAPYPVGRGSAKSWVEKRYPAEVREMRRRNYQRNLGLLVGTDADEQSVQQRFDALAAVLAHEQLRPRDNDERIVFWVPKWNVETWILHLSGDTRDENQNYRREVERPDFPAVAEAFLAEYRAFHNGRDVSTLPSLKTAYSETERLEV